MKDPQQPGSFKRAISLVNWSPLVLGVLALIATISVWLAATPVHRPFFIFDASISGAKKDITFNVPVQVGVSIVMALIQLVAAEFVVLAGMRSRSLQIAHFMQALFHLFAVFWFTSFTQQFFAVAVGKQRPSFLAECQPSLEAYGDDNLPFYTPNSNFRAYAVDRSTCTQTDTLDDASKSFFSGHASSSALLGVYAAVHLLYTLLVRAPPRWQNCQPTSAQVMSNDFKRGLVLLFTNAQLLWVFVVGASRFIDNKHHVEDVIFGLFVGTMYALFGLLDLWAVERDTMSRVAAAPVDRLGMANDPGVPATVL